MRDKAKSTYKKLLQIKKKPVARKKSQPSIVGVEYEILRNTAINSFRSDEKPTKRLILERMQELKQREQKQKQIAILHNKLLQLHSSLPVFAGDEEDEDFVPGDDSNNVEDLEELGHESGASLLETSSA